MPRWMRMIQCSQIQSYGYCLNRVTGKPYHITGTADNIPENPTADRGRAVDISMDAWEAVLLALHLLETVDERNPEEFDKQGKAWAYSPRTRAAFIKAMRKLIEALEKAATEAT